MNHDAIDGTGFPLGFKTRVGVRAATVAGIAPARDVFRVEARTMSGHQKELVVSEGAAGDAWRMTSDEGANLKGTDLAPFPLTFFNAGLHADFANRAIALARTRGVPLRIDSIQLDNQYYFNGSFFRGTGEGSAEAVNVRVAARSSAPAAQVQALLDAALAASPAHALMALAQRDTFALYVNGRRCPVVRVAASGQPDQVDPFKAHPAPPVPLPDAADAIDAITRLSPDPTAGPTRVLPGEGRVPIPIRGSSTVDASGLVATTVTPPSAGARFRVVCDESPAGGRAPSGLACIAAGIAFCYMTQFTRYIEHRQHKVRAIRLVQTLPFTLSADGPDGALRGGLEPVDTHVFLHAEDPDEVMQNLLQVAENTCYLHAALRASLPGKVTLSLNA